MSNTTKLTNEHRSAIRGAFNAILCGMTYEDRDEAAEQAWQWFEDEVLSELPSDTDADLDALDAIGDEAIAFCESLAADEDGAQHPIGLTTEDAALVKELFWAEFARSNDADQAAHVAGDHANSVYDDTNDPDYVELNTWFDSLVEQALK